MEPVLDEASLSPSSSLSPAVRIRTLAETLTALDGLGVAPVLRSVRGAPDLDIGGGAGLRRWCFDWATDRDAGRLVAGRLGKQPFIDGVDGLLAAAEGERAVEAKVGDTMVFGLALAALEDGVATALAGAAHLDRQPVRVEVTTLETIGDVVRETIAVRCLVTVADVEADRESIQAALSSELCSGEALLARAGELFPRLRFGDGAVRQIGTLSGNEPFFRQLVRHLRALHQGAREWEGEAAYAPAAALPWSRESGATLGHGVYGPMRDFPTPAGYAPERWSMHTKLTGGGGMRLYFRPVRTEQGPAVLIGYFGAHLPTVRFR